MSSFLRMLLASAVPMQRAVYIVAHQDDELLSMGAAIMADAAAGRRVMVLLTSKGENSAARTMPALTGPLGRTPTKEEFSAHRDREFTETVTRLGGVPVIPPYAERESDGFADVGNIKALARKYLPAGSPLRSHATTDTHQDHNACGMAAAALYKEGWGYDLRHHLAKWNQAAHTPPGVTLTREASGGVATAEHAWAYYTQDIPNGWWGVGYISAPVIFDEWAADGASWWHPPLDPSGAVAHYGTATYGSSVFA